MKSDLLNFSTTSADVLQKMKKKNKKNSESTTKGMGWGAQADLKQSDLVLATVPTLV